MKWPYLDVQIRQKGGKYRRRNDTVTGLCSTPQGYNSAGLRGSTVLWDTPAWQVASMSGMGWVVRGIGQVHFCTAIVVKSVTA